MNKRKTILFISIMCVSMELFSNQVIGNTFIKQDLHTKFENNSITISSNKIIKIDKQESNKLASIEISKITEKPIETVEQIDNIIEKISSKYDIPEDFIKTICIIESDYNANCTGPNTNFGRAKGIMQLIPMLVKDYKVSNPYNIEENINAGTQYLKYLIDRYSTKDYFDQNGRKLSIFEIVAIAYNWGFVNLENHMKRHECIVIAKTENGIPLETYNYIQKLRKYYINK